MHVDIATTIALIAAVGIPFLVDLVTKDVAEPKLKAALAFGLATLAGVIPTVVYDPHTGWHSYLYNIAIAFVVAMTTHSTGVSDAIQKATADTGIGKPRKTSATFKSTPTKPVVPPVAEPTKRATPPRKTAKKSTSSRK